jgi:hypothetical protein
MNEQRRKILEMLGQGKISADEAERLIDALDREQAPVTTKTRPKYLRVVVDVDEGTGGDKPSKVNVRVPLKLLRAGVRLASLIPPQALTQANAELSKSGVPIDLTRLKPEDIEALVEELDDVTIDVDQPDAKVKVFCE